MAPAPAHRSSAAELGSLVPRLDLKSRSSTQVSTPYRSSTHHRHLAGSWAGGGRPPSATAPPILALCFETARLPALRQAASARPAGLRASRATRASARPRRGGAAQRAWAGRAAAARVFVRRTTFFACRAPRSGACSTKRWPARLIGPVGLGGGCLGEQAPSLRAAGAAKALLGPQKLAHGMRGLPSGACSTNRWPARLSVQDGLVGGGSGEQGARGGDTGSPCSFSGRLNGVGGRGATGRRLARRDQSRRA